MQPHGATWLQVFLADSCEGNARLTNQPCEEAEPNGHQAGFTLMMMLTSRAEKRATGQMGRVYGDERRGEKC